MKVAAVQAVFFCRVQGQPHQGNFNGDHDGVFDHAGAQVIQVTLAIQHSFPHTAQQHIAAVIDQQTGHDQARDGGFALVEHNAVNQAGQHGRNQIAGEIRLAIAGKQKAQRINDRTNAHAHQRASETTTKLK